MLRAKKVRRAQKPVGLCSTQPFTCKNCFVQKSLSHLILISCATFLILSCCDKGLLIIKNENNWKCKLKYLSHFYWNISKSLTARFLTKYSKNYNKTMHIMTTYLNICNICNFKTTRVILHEVNLMIFSPCKNAWVVSWLVIRKKPALKNVRIC